MKTYYTDNPRLKGIKAAMRYLHGKKSDSFKEFRLKKIPSGMALVIEEEKWEEYGEHSGGIYYVDKPIYRLFIERDQ